MKIHTSHFQNTRKHWNGKHTEGAGAEDIEVKERKTQQPNGNKISQVAQWVKVLMAKPDGMNWLHSEDTGTDTL